MAWLLIGGIALVVAIIVFIICWKTDSQPYEYGKYLFSSGAIGIGVFLLVTMFSSIICSTLDINVFNNRDKFVNLSSQMYHLENIQESQYIILNTQETEINFIYKDEDNNLIINTAPIESVKIYTNVYGEPARIQISNWELKNWYVKSILGKDAYITTYEIYLPDALQIIN